MPQQHNQAHRESGGMHASAAAMAGIARWLPDVCAAPQQPGHGAQSACMQCMHLPAHRTGTCGGYGTWTQPTEITPDSLPSTREQHCTLCSHGMLPLYGLIEGAGFRARQQGRLHAFAAVCPRTHHTDHQQPSALCTDAAAICKRCRSATSHRSLGLEATLPEVVVDGTAHSTQHATSTPGLPTQRQKHTPLRCET